VVTDRKIWEENKKICSVELIISERIANKKLTVITASWQLEGSMGKCFILQVFTGGIPEIIMMRLCSLNFQIKKKLNHDRTSPHYFLRENFQW
jgi:hypothetical protein